MISSCPTNNLASELVENEFFLKPITTEEIVIFITKLKIGLPWFHFSYYVGSCHYSAILIQSESPLQRQFTESLLLIQAFLSFIIKQQVKKHIRFLYNEKEDKDKSFCLFIKEGILFLFIYSLIINLLQVMTIISYHFFVFIFIYFIIFHFILSFIS